MIGTWVFSGRAHPDLARELALRAGVSFGRAEIGHFADGELSVQVVEDVGGSLVFLVQPTSSAEAIVEVALLADALKRARPRRLFLILPYFGYQRQERRTGQSPVSAQVIAGVLNNTRADMLVTLDLHAPVICDFIGIPHLEMHSTGLFADSIRSLRAEAEPIVVVSPDRGGVERARRLSFALGIGQPVLVLHKSRLAPDRCEVSSDGKANSLAGQHAILVDDIVSTGGTLIQAAQSLADLGAARIWACVTHLVGRPDGLARRLEDSPVERLFVTDSLPARESLAGSRIQTLGLAPALAAVLLRLARPMRVRRWVASIRRLQRERHGWLPHTASDWAVEGRHPA